MKGIAKPTGAKENTFMTVVDGMSVFPESFEFQKIRTTVMFTSDKVGETLTLADPVTKHKIVIPFEKIQALIDHTRKKRG